MKTLDVVIKAIENCEIKKQNCLTCPYRNDGGNCYALDALHYLRNYRSDKIQWEADRKLWADKQEQVDEARQKYIDKLKELEIGTLNDPLTWDELKAMKGKPVWVELTYPEGGYSHWGIIEGFPKAGYEFMTLRGFHRIDSFSLMAKEMGKTWQAYRKEHK